MAIPLSLTALLPFHPNSLKTSRSENPLPTPFYGKTLRYLSSKFGSIRARTPLQVNQGGSPKIDESLSSIITELEREKGEQEEGEIEKQANKKLADCWREIHGQDNWSGLLDPMDPLLRAELIRYGEMAQACYDAFDFDPFSKYCGGCKYIRRKFFEPLGLADHDYKVTRFLYATSTNNLLNFFKISRRTHNWSDHANWIGYIAVSSDAMTKRLGRRDITIAWRGTVTELEWIENLTDLLIPIAPEINCCHDPMVKVERGFLNLYTSKKEDYRFCKYSVREQILDEVSDLVRQYSNEELSISVTGHSLGSALAMLSAYDIAETGLNVVSDGCNIPVSVFSFSGPRVGNRRFKKRIEGLGVKVLRVVNVHDMVPNVPGILVNENMPLFVRWLLDWLPWSYRHVGVKLELDHKHSPFLRDTVDPTCLHNLEAHLHLLDGFISFLSVYSLFSCKSIYTFSSLLYFLLVVAKIGKNTAKVV
ncbi:phospholipase A1-Igamma1, chloroplastic-like [Tasmannia lanceolata]|uniref:phospholipase A1-Igamma1, chloroplastic-like n=1 Tax=Tasmannia lanceolata TaxID=3420 RepID=UPI004062CF17